MQSVYKLPIAMAILDQVERKTLTLNQKVSLSAATWSRPPSIARFATRIRTAGSMSACAS